MNFNKNRGIIRAKEGNRDEDRTIGDVYKRQGEGVEKNPAWAVKWFRRAAEQGSTASMCDLGWCYETGAGVRRNRRKAVEWYEKAAEQGDAEGMYRLALCYLDGKAVEADRQTAMDLCRRALESEELHGGTDTALQEKLHALMERLES